MIYQIHARDGEHFKKLLKRLFSFGYVYTSCRYNTPTDAIRKGGTCHWMLIGCDADCKRVLTPCGNEQYGREYKTTTISEFVRKILPALDKPKKKRKVSP